MNCKFDHSLFHRALRLFDAFAGKSPAGRGPTIAVLTLALSLLSGALPHRSFAQHPTGHFRAHNQGTLQLTVGAGGWGYLDGFTGEEYPVWDPITEDSVFGCVYPRSSGLTYMDGAFLAGALVGDDTLVVSVYDISRIGLMSHSRWKERSANIGSKLYSPEALAELDLEVTFADTTELDHPWSYGMWSWSEEAPLGISVTQRSLSWSGASVDDFVMITYEVTNVGDRILHDFYAGFWCNQHGGNLHPNQVGDHLTGFLSASAPPHGCVPEMAVNLAYMMDDDGDPIDGRFGTDSRRGAVGLSLLGAPGNVVRVGYGWMVWNPGYSQDWGPRPRPTNDEPWRSFNPFYAWPGNDRNLYYLMSQPHVAYDQMFAATHQTGWMPPNQLSELVASGWTSDMYYTIGPFEIGVHERVSFTIAVVGGDNVHNDPYAQFDPLDPQPFYDQLDFSELATNARWAQWVYDNPGYDTDSDGYAGEFRICEGDTIWYKGDGVPDFRGNTPPPAPFTKVLTEHGKLIIRWNGYLSETTKDPFSNLVDFEGYRVYSGLDTRRASLSVLSSYDRENFFRLKWHDLGAGHGKWLNDEPPYTLDDLREIHNDADFDPLRYTRDYPLFEGDSAFHFEMVDANLDDLTLYRGIHKAYPDALDPGPDSTLWTENDITYEHGRALPKYYEYEYVLEDMLPTVPYFVAVTSFDFGYAGGRGNLPPDESNPLNNLTECYAQTSSDSVEANNLDVYVYPNPYRADADYHERGYENRAGRIIPDRARLLHFGNLPKVCKISIFSLDGDLIGSLDHNFPEGGPESMHDWWNLVSRSGLAVESGLYYFVVESDTRTQIGKFVILK